MLFAINYQQMAFKIFKSLEYFSVTLSGGFILWKWPCCITGVIKSEFEKSGCAQRLCGLPAASARRFPTRRTRSTTTACPRAAPRPNRRAAPPCRTRRRCQTAASPPRPITTAPLRWVALSAPPASNQIKELVSWICRRRPQFDLPAEEFADFLPDGELLAVPLVVEEKSGVDGTGTGGPAPSPSLDLNDNEDLPTELSDSSETHDEGTKLSWTWLSAFLLWDYCFSRFFFMDFLSWFCVIVSQLLSVCVRSSISATEIKSSKFLFYLYEISIEKYLYIKYLYIYLYNTL